MNDNPHYTFYIYIKGEGQSWAKEELLCKEKNVALDPAQMGNEDGAQNRCTEGGFSSSSHSFSGDFWVAGSLRQHIGG